MGQSGDGEIRIGVGLGGGVSIALKQDDRLTGAGVAGKSVPIQAISGLQLRRGEGDSQIGVDVIDVGFIATDWQACAGRKEGEIRYRAQRLVGHDGAQRDGFGRGKRNFAEWLTSFQIDGALGQSVGLVAFETGDDGDIVAGRPGEMRRLHICLEDLTLVVELMQFGAEGSFYGANGTTGANGESVRIDIENGETMAFEFLTDGLNLVRRR